MLYEVITDQAAVRPDQPRAAADKVIVVVGERMSYNFV